MVVSWIKDYCRNEKGTFAVGWAASIATILVAVGAGVDVNLMQNSQKKAQNVADVAALQAATYFYNHSEAPKNSSDGLVEDEDYSAAKVGIELKQGENILFKVDYDDDNNEVRVDSWGARTPTFLQMFGYNKLDFSATSTVNYPDPDEKTAASVTLVVDNSGSMWFDDKPAIKAKKCKRWRRGKCVRWISTWKRPNGAKRRIDGLKSSAKSFTAKLNELQDQTETPIIRTGLISYDHKIITSDTHKMSWDILTNANINHMSPKGGTNSAQAMQKAVAWSNGEVEEHKKVNANVTPMRFVVFMTDGQNSQKHYDTNTLSHCKSLKADGVTIFTIGFSLEAGKYWTNEWSNNWITIDKTLGKKASNLLESCATSNKHFFLASDADDLLIAFDDIGERISEEAMRIAH